MKHAVRLAVLVLCAILFIVPSGPSDKQIEKTALFNVAFPLAGWAGDKGEFRNEPDYCTLEYRFEDEHSEGAAIFRMIVQSGAALYYRDSIMKLSEITDRTTLDETHIGGIDFLYADYGGHDTPSRMYAARVPESNINIWIAIHQAPGAVCDVQPILDTIHFTLPRLWPAHKDPPLPENSARYAPQPVKIQLRKINVQATWLPTVEPWLVMKMNLGKIAFTDDTLYTLLGRRLYAHSIQDGWLAKATVFPDGVLKLPDGYASLSMTGDGTLFVSNVKDEVFSIKEGAITPYNNQVGQGCLAMHPSGKWGICFNGLDVTERVYFNENGLTHENWVPRRLGGQQDQGGRFDSIDIVSITNDRVYIAGHNKIESNWGVAAFDLSGRGLYVIDPKYMEYSFGATDVVQTQNSIVIVDSENLLVFSLDGSFLGAVNCDELLGTDDADILSITPAEDGIYLAATQVRSDWSGTELLLFHITGF